MATIWPYRGADVILMNIATTAPSGNVGSHVVRNLIRAGVRPRVLGHRTESLDPALRSHTDLRVVELRVY